MHVELDLLRPALQTAIEVARTADAPSPPRPLRPFLRFARLPPRASQVVRDVLDEDDEFRQRVAAVVADERVVGRAGWLFLHRPDGWADEYAALLEERSGSTDARRADSVQREMARLRRAVAALEDRIGRQAAELVAVGARSNEHHAALLAAIEDAERLRAERDAALEERGRAVRELKDTERRLAELHAARSATPTVAPSEAPSEREESVVGPALSTLAVLAADVRRQWEETGAALDAWEDALAGAEPAPVDRDPGSGSGSGSGRSARRRRPVRLSRGMEEDSPAAASWLLNRPGAVVLVDGYNVSMLGWPELAVVDQRRALEVAVVGLQHRTGAQFVLVFDGDGPDATFAVRTSVGSPVRVRFTAEGVEADDALLEMVDASTSPVVVVVSNDRRVRQGARERGANTVRSTDLLALLR